MKNESVLFVVMVKEKVGGECIEFMEPTSHLAITSIPVQQERMYIPTSLIHLHGQTVPLKRENRTTFTEGVPLHINFL